VPIGPQARGPRAVAFDVATTGGPLVLEHGDARMTLEDLSLRLSGDGTAGRVEFSLTGRPRLARPGAEEVAGDPIDLHGAVLGAGAGMTLEASIKADGLPTVLPDAMAGLDGLLVAAIGPLMDASIDTKGFSGDSGRLDGEITTSHGRIEVHVEARGGVVATAPDAPIRAELDATPSLATGCLKYIHPALGDIVSTARRIEIEIADLSVPWRGDPSRLNAVIRIDIGDARFRASSEILAPLKMFGDVISSAMLRAGQGTSADVRTVEGFVEPIQATIRDGVVTYDRFVIQIGKDRLPYTGTIDLPARTLDIRTEVPVIALGGDIVAEIPVLPTSLVVPIRSSGSFDNIKTDVQFGNLIDRIPGSILERLLGNGKKADGRSR